MRKYACMKLENNNIKISISKQMMEVVENVFTLTVCPDTDSQVFFMLPTYVFVTEAAHLCGFLRYHTSALFFANFTASSWLSDFCRLSKLKHFFVRIPTELPYTGRKDVDKCLFASRRWVYSSTSFKVTSCMNVTLSRICLLIRYS